MRRVHLVRGGASGATHAASEELQGDRLRPRREARERHGVPAPEEAQHSCARRGSAFRGGQRRRGTAGGKRLRAGTRRQRTHAPRARQRTLRPPEIGARRGHGAHAGVLALSYNTCLCLLRGDGGRGGGGCQCWSQRYSSSIRDSVERRVSSRPRARDTAASSIRSCSLIHGLGFSQLRGGRARVSAEGGGGRANDVPPGGCRRAEVGQRCGRGMERAMCTVGAPLGGPRGTMACPGGASPLRPGLFQHRSRLATTPRGAEQVAPGPASGG